MSTGEKSGRQKREKSFLTNKVFHGRKGAMSLRAKSVNVSTLCQLGTGSGEADEDKKVLPPPSFRGSAGEWSETQWKMAR